MTLRTIFYFVVGVGVVVLEGVFAFYRLREWRRLPLLQKFGAIRDVLALLALLVIGSLVGTGVVLAVLEDAR